MAAATATTPVQRSASSTSMQVSTDQLIASVTGLKNQVKIQWSVFWTIHM